MSQGHSYVTQRNLIYNMHTHIAFEKQHYHQQQQQQVQNEVHEHFIVENVHTASENTFSQPNMIYKYI